MINLNDDIAIRSQQLTNQPCINKILKPNLNECFTTTQFITILSSNYSSNKEHFEEFKLNYQLSLLKTKLEINKDSIILNQNNKLLSPMDSSFLNFQEFIIFVIILNKSGCKLQSINVNYYHKSKSMRSLLKSCCEKLYINDENAYSDILLLQQFSKFAHNVQNFKIPFKLTLTLINSLNPLTNISHLTICFNDENNEISDVGVTKLCKDLEKWAKEKKNKDQIKSLIIKAKSSPLLRRSIRKLISIKTSNTLKVSFQLKKFTLSELIYLYPVKNSITHLSLIEITDYDSIPAKLEVFSYLQEIDYNFIRSAETIVVGHSNAEKMVLTTSKSVKNLCFTKQTRLTRLEASSGDLVFFGGDIHSSLVDLLLTCTDGNDPILLGENLEKCTLNLTFNNEHQVLRNIVNGYELSKLKSLNIQIKVISINKRKIPKQPFENFLGHLPLTLINFTFKIIIPSIDEEDKSLGDELQYLSFSKFDSLQSLHFIIGGFEDSKDDFESFSFSSFGLSSLPHYLTYLELKIPCKSYIDNFPSAYLRELDLNLVHFESPLNDFLSTKLATSSISVLKLTVGYSKQLNIEDLPLKSLTSFTLTISQSGPTGNTALNDTNIELEIPPIIPYSLIEFKIISGLSNYRIYLKSSLRCKIQERILLTPKENFTWVIGQSLDSLLKEGYSVTGNLKDFIFQNDPITNNENHPITNNENHLEVDTENIPNKELVIGSSNEISKDLIGYFEKTYSSVNLLST